MDNFISYKHKLVDFGVKNAEFDGEDGKKVKFKQTVLRVDLDGDVEDIALSGQKAPSPVMLALILRGATGEPEAF